MSFSSIQASSVVFASPAQPPVCVQEKEERKVRMEYRPSDRRVAQQLKADEDFALRMQRQELEIEKHQAAHFREAQRRQMVQFDMGGVPQQTSQVASPCSTTLPHTPFVLKAACLQVQITAPTLSY